MRPAKTAVTIGVRLTNKDHESNVRLAEPLVYSPAKLKIREQKRYNYKHTPNETTIEALKEAEASGE
jgi:hypothetical protein